MVAAAVVAVRLAFVLSPEKIVMDFKHMISTILVSLLVVVTPIMGVAQAEPPARIEQQGYPTPEDAAAALSTAVRAQDLNRMLSVIGPAARAWLSSGDEVSDRHEWERFSAAYERKHAIGALADGRGQLLVGDDDWPFPAPIVRRGERWFFDAAAGRDELLNRRIGRNELDTIQTLLAIVDAQREYAAGDLDGNGFNDYARRFVSTRGTRDGLFWPVTANESASPLGDLIGTAAREGYSRSAQEGQPRPFHGYFYRLLSGQGKAARGGAFSYLVDDRLIGGFAVVAYPAKYGVSGVMTFAVNHDGVVYQKNFGGQTPAAARRIKLFDPDASWRKVD